MLDTEYNEEEVRRLFINDGIEIGIERGRKEGKEEGKKEGKDETIVTQICKKLLKGKDAATIADEIEEPVERVTKICEIAKKYLPDYDPRKIMEELGRVTN